MDLEEQNKLADEIGKLLLKRVKETPFHVSISVAGKAGDAFAFSITILSEKDSFENCRSVVGGIVNEANALVHKFEFPSEVKFKKPVEFK